MAAPSFAGTADLAPLDAPQTAGTAQDSSELAMSGEVTTTLPETVAYVPVNKPGGGFPEVATAQAGAIQPATNFTPQAAQAAASDAQAQGAAAAAAGDSRTAKPAVEVPADYPVYVTATDPNQPPAPAPKKRGFLSSLFGSSEADAAPLVEEPAAPKPIVTLASTGGEKPLVKTASLAAGDSPGVLDEMDALPGVRKTALFEIKRKSGLDDDSDVDLHEDEDSGPYQVASAAGLARLAPNGLITQTESVDVACLKPSLVRVLKTVEQHYGRKVIITSGYRSPSHNRRARGAKNSLHMYCAAADVQVPGVGKWELASYFRTMPGRGGVGTYCHTESVHIDVGPERDWNWRCRRRRA